MIIQDAVSLKEAFDAASSICDGPAEGSKTCPCTEVGQLFGEPAVPVSYIRARIADLRQKEQSLGGLMPLTGEEMLVRIGELKRLLADNAPPESSNG